jgi:hypothetical protein
VRLARRDFVLSALEPGNVAIILKHGVNDVIFRFSRDPKGRNGDDRTILFLMLDCPPSAPLRQRAVFG